ncbi:inositol monophosphatase family protein [Nesterenkonia suensis]
MEQHHIYRSLALTARHAAESVSSDIAENFLGDLDVSHKTSSLDPVTEIDRRAERRISEILLSAQPGSSIIGEEFGHTEGAEGAVRWHIDPLDGTLNYVSGIPYFCTSIGVEVRGEIVAGVVHDPLRQETFWGWTGGACLNDQPLAAASDHPGEDAVNTIWPFVGLTPESEVHAEFIRTLRGLGAVRGRGSYALQIAHVAAGRASVALEVRATSPWDVAGGFGVAQGAGCFLYHLESAPDGFGSWATPTFIVARDRGVGDMLAAELERVVAP